MTVSIGLRRARQRRSELIAPLLLSSLPKSSKQALTNRLAVEGYPTTERLDVSFFGVGHSGLLQQCSGLGWSASGVAAILFSSM